MERDEHMGSPEENSGTLSSSPIAGVGSWAPDSPKGSCPSTVSSLHSILGLSHFALGAHSPQLGHSRARAPAPWGPRTGSSLAVPRPELDLQMYPRPLAGPMAQWV